MENGLHGAETISTGITLHENYKFPTLSSFNFVSTCDLDFNKKKYLLITSCERAL